MSQQNMKHSLPLHESEDGENFDWKYFLKPLLGKRTVETDRDIVTQPDFGKSDPHKCLYHVISQALVNQQLDTENLKSRQVETLKRKISTKLKPDDFLPSIGKVRRLEKSQSLNLPSAKEGGRSDLRRAVTDPGFLRQDTKNHCLGKLKEVTSGDMGDASDSFTQSEVLDRSSSTSSVADSGFDEVDAKMISPNISFRRPQLFASPIKGLKSKVQVKLDLDSEEDLDSDGFCTISSEPSHSEKHETSKTGLSSKLVKFDVDICQDSSCTDLKAEYKRENCENTEHGAVELSFDVVPHRISKKKMLSSERGDLVEDKAEVKKEKRGILLDCNNTVKVEKAVERIQEEVFGETDVCSDRGLVQKDASRKNLRLHLHLEIKKEEAGLEEFHHVEEMYGAYTAIKNIRPDLESSASRWTIPVLQRYIKKRYIDLIKPMVPTDVCQLTIKERAHLRKQLIDQSILMFSPGHHFRKEYPLFGEFQKWRIQEADIRLFLNVLLRRLCLKLHMQMKVEERITGDNLPNAVCDYAFYKNNVCIGLLEAKSPSGLEPKAVPQFLVELLNIQARYASSDLPIFGILSDAHRFVFINLTGTKFRFEQTEMMQIHIHQVFSWSDLFTIADVILNNFHKQISILKACLLSNSQGLADVSDDSDVCILD